MEDVREKIKQLDPSSESKPKEIHKTDHSTQKIQKSSPCIELNVKKRNVPEDIDRNALETSKSELINRTLNPCIEGNTGITKEEEISELEQFYLDRGSFNEVIASTNMVMDIKNERNGIPHRLMKLKEQVKYTINPCEEMNLIKTYSTVDRDILREKILHLYEVCKSNLLKMNIHDMKDHSIQELLNFANDNQLFNENDAIFVELDLLKQ